MARSRRAWAPLAFIVVLAASALTTVLVEDWSPHLGLDLQGGASVVYQAAEGTPEEASLEDAIEIIRSRVDALGVAEPEIVLQGDAIVVNLPGIDDRDRALEVIGQTAELQFRPVLGVCNVVDINTCIEASTLVPLDESSTTSTTAPAEGEATTTTAPPATDDTTTTSEGALAPGVVEGENAAVLLPRQEEGTTTTAAPAEESTTTATTAADGATSTTAPPVELDACDLLGGATLVAEEEPGSVVVFPGTEEVEGNAVSCYVLGPVPTDGERSLVGSIIRDPTVDIQQGQWGVSLNIRGDDLDLFNQTASSCFFRDSAVCPTQLLGIVLDGEVRSAPAIQEASFGGDGLRISGSFSEREARDLGLVLRFGALPVELVPQTVQQVSATLGEDSLDAGLVAGFLGVALVVLYMLLYYRALGLVVVLGLCVWAALLFSIISWLGETQELALSLAGITGIVVSVGVTVDSYVVYFERLKEEIRSGKTVRSSVDRSFQRAFRTILTADVSSFIGAFLLYTLTVGPVRGFAFFLGLSTVLDVVVAWFFTRPLVGILGRRDFFARSKRFGIARGTSVTAAEVPA